MSNVISIGGLVIDHGFSFFWVPHRSPFLIAPSGRRVNLVVVGKIPYLTLLGRSSQHATELHRWNWAASRVIGFLESSGLMGVPPATSIRSRTTLDMHTHELLADHGYVNGELTGDSYDPDPFSSGPRDTVT